MDYDPVVIAYIGRPVLLKTGQVYILEALTERIINAEEDDFDAEEFEDG